MVAPTVHADCFHKNDAFAVSGIKHAFTASAVFVRKIAIADGFFGALF